jgi:L-lysine exporter family protein LysE/ArgO
MHTLLAPALAGFALMAGLIVAIGAQNAFILRQGLLRANVPLLVGVAALLDASLIIAGSAGFGTFVHAHADMLVFISWAGAVFIAAYGLLAIKRAFHPTTLIPSQTAGLSPMQAVRVLLMVSLLNPHVYLDTVVLVGGIAGRYPGDARIAYTAGAVAASAVWFTLLGFGARLLEPIFARPLAWRVLDAVIALVMFAIAASLVQSALAS